MRIYRSLEELPASLLRTVLTVGNFDGIHLGHQRIIAHVVNRSRQVAATALAVTFDPHPAKVLIPKQAPPLLTTLAQRLDLLAQLGLDAVLVIAFSPELSRLTPREFISEIVCNRLAALALYVGPSFRFGYRQAGDVPGLSLLAKEFGFALHVVPPVVMRGQAISSTQIRHLVGEGQVERAARLLGRPYALTGTITPGSGRGAQSLVPTLNFLPEQECLPGRGVYITETLVGGKTYPSATNVGVRPTFAGDRLIVESHLLDFDRELTEGYLEVRFHRRLRAEKKFSSSQALRKQIQRDLATTRQFFQGFSTAKVHARSPSVPEF